MMYYPCKHHGHKARVKNIVEYLEGFLELKLRTFVDHITRKSINYRSEDVD